MTLLDALQSATEDVDTAIASLYRHEADRLVGMLWMYTGDRATAEDLVQEAFLRLQRSWGRIRDPQLAPAYLRSIGFNLARSRWRRLRAAADRQLPTEPAPSAEYSALLAEERAVIAAALAGLPSRQRECLVLRYFGGSSDSSTAQTLGISANSVKTHVRRGLAALRGTLEMLGYSPDTARRVSPKPDVDASVA